MKKLLCILFTIIFINSCKQATTDSGSSGTPGTLTLTEQTSLPQSGGNASAVEFMPTGEMVAIVDNKLYEVHADGSAPRMINGDFNSHLAIGPDGSIYTLAGAGMRRYDFATGTFTSITLIANIGSESPIDITFSPAGELFVCFTDNFGFGKAIYSTDKGATWTNMKLADVYTQNDIAFGNGGIYTASGEGAYFTSDHGITWQRLCTYPVNTLGRVLFIAKNGDMFSFDDGGGFLYTSHDGGKTFTSNNWPKGLSVTHHMREGANGTLYMAGKNGTSDVGVLKSTDAGATWTNILPCSIGWIAINGSKFAVGTMNNHGVLYSTDGNTWTAIGSGISPVPTSIAFDRNGELLLCADHGLYRLHGGSWNYIRWNADKVVTDSKGDILVASAAIAAYSSDNGVSWKTSKINQQFTTYLFGPQIFGTTSASTQDFYIGIAEYNTNINEYANGELLRSTDGGATFNHAESKLGGSHDFTSLTSSGTTLYGIDEYELAGPNADALQSDDNGANWTKFTGKHFPLCFNSSGHYVSVYHATDAGFLLSTSTSDDGKKYKVASFGGHTFIKSALFSTDNKLYCIINDAGVGKTAIYIADQALN
jgi:photosystem II stability/assembly factor-like uncharacterized protein